MAPTKQERFKEFRYKLPIICSCGYDMKCITKKTDVKIDRDIITTKELELIKHPYYPNLDIIETQGNREIDPNKYVLYECINCLIRIKIGNYEGNRF